METFDVVVIGGGAAGASAALCAAGAGASVLLLRRAPGATALAHGSWRTPPPDELRRALSHAGLDLVDCDGALPHPDGTLVRPGAVASSHARASLVTGSRPMLVCGIDGLPGFRAHALAALWTDQAGLPEGTLEAVTITLADTPSAGWSPVSLAARLERDPAHLGVPLARAVREHGAAAVILPAILGLDHHARVLQTVGDAAGVVVGEALGAAPSVPGWRLDQALLHALAQAKVRVLGARVQGGSFHTGALQQVTALADRGPAVFTARAFVLATGKFVGGGIGAGLEFVETALDCDVAIERFTQTIDDPGAALMLTDPVRSEPQPVLSIGVRTDSGRRPLTAAGDVRARNVFVAGTVRAGVEAAALGLGAAAHEGWNAGQRAAAYTGAPS